MRSGTLSSEIGCIEMTHEEYEKMSAELRRIADDYDEFVDEAMVHREGADDKIVKLLDSRAKSLGFMAHCLRIAASVVLWETGP
jgi:hypothetical protein